ncbi:MAG: hypothetical protein WAO95_10200 [Burkholderiales bacterium]
MAAPQAVEFGAPVTIDALAAIGVDQRCECPAIVQDVQAALPESGRSFLLAHEAGAGAVLSSSNPRSVALAMHASASSFIARRSVQPPYLLIPRLRQ